MAARARARALFTRGAIGQKPKISRGLPVGSLIKCTDNSGAKILRVIQVLGYKGRLRRNPSASVGDAVIVSVRKGTPDMRRKIFRAVIVRQRKEYRRPDGTRVKFEDNAAVITNEFGEPKGTEIRGPVAKEAAERWPKIATIATLIV